MELWFEDLSYPAPMSGKRLLDDVSGRFSAGQLTAILGPSGAGKTTLLNAISGYRRIGVQGKMVTGYASCYIGQEELLASHFSVEELMFFAGRLKLPTRSAQERTEIVETLLGSLGLQECRGTWTNRLSGGQRRRLSIALELVDNPPVLFLDEPTSGLDVVSANQLVRLLSKLCRDGRSIICTIHQPSTSLFNLFDKVYFLAEGRCIYQGGPGVHLVTFLAMQGFVCPEHYNPADYVLELVEESSNADILCKASKNGKLSWYNKPIEENSFSKLKTAGATSVSKCGLLDDRTVLCDRRDTVPSFCIQFSVIVSRILLQDKRNKTGLLLQLIHHVLSGLVFGSMFFRKLNEGHDFMIQIKFCVSLAVFHCYTQQMIPIVYYPFEAKLLKKEHFNCWYNLLPYCVAFAVAKAPYKIFLNLLYTLILYALVGLPWELTRFALFFGISLLTAFTAEPLGLVIGALFSFTTGSIVGPMVMGSFLGLAMYGYDYMRSIPPLMEAVVQTSYMRSSVFAYILSIYGLDKGHMDCSESIDHCIFKDPRVVLHFLDFERLPLWQPVGELCISLFVFWLMFYLALKWKLRR